MNDFTILALVAAVGLVLGSAVTALAHRVPRGVSWVHGRSACPACGHVLEPRDLIPVVSWLLARGRCRHCGVHVPFRYPLTELLCAAWCVLLVLKVGIGWTTPFLALWGVILVALMWIDLDFQLLPDVLTFPGTVIGLAATLQLPGGARHALFGILLGAGILWLLSWIWIRFRKIEGMGFGDVKLAAMFGVVLGGPLTLVALFLASLAGALWGAVLMARGAGNGKTALPFGTLLAPAALIAFLWGDVWLGAYFRLLR